MDALESLRADLSTEYGSRVPRSYAHFVIAAEPLDRRALGLGGGYELGRRTLPVAWRDHTTSYHMWQPEFFSCTLARTSRSRANRNGRPGCREFLAEHVRRRPARAEHAPDLGQRVVIARRDPTASCGDVCVDFSRLGPRRLYGHGARHRSTLRGRRVERRSEAPSSRAPRRVGLRGRRPCRTAQLRKPLVARRFQRTHAVEALMPVPPERSGSRRGAARPNRRRSARR
jgi:hypothetical protein